MGFICNSREVSILFLTSDLGLLKSVKAPISTLALQKVAPNSCERVPVSQILSSLKTGRSRTFASVEVLYSLVGCDLGNICAKVCSAYFRLISVVCTDMTHSP
jgi:hypothetical protein